ncbi:MAG: calcium-binding protein [Pseudomonadota bacterium]
MSLLELGKEETRDEVADALMVEFALSSGTSAVSGGGASNHQPESTSIFEVSGIYNAARVVNRLEHIDVSTARKTLAAEIAESAEHLFVGNTHRATNNYDVLMNAAQFERVLDRTEVEDTIKSLIDTMFDRDPTDYEMEHYSERLLEGEDTPEDLVKDMMTLNDAGLVSLSELTGEDLVAQAFLNALGREPSTVELTTWKMLLENNDISEEGFIVALAMSIEADAAGNAHDSTPYSSDPGIISNVYIWSKGDGNDLIQDFDNSNDTDKLVLSDVDASDVQIIRNHGSTDLYIQILSTGEEIRIQYGMHSSYVNYGIEEIEFADGTIWDAETIVDQTIVEGSEANNTIYGTNIFSDNIFGNSGNDSLYGYSGNDKITGGKGEDWLDGGVGSDSYFWSKGDGNDTISDTSTSTIETDRLILSDVTSDDVSLTRAHNGWDLEIEVLSTGEVIKVYYWFHTYTDNGRGIEELEFTDGTVWTTQDILDATTIEGTDANQTINGFHRSEHIKGLEGNDTINASAGDDTLEGGAGNDYLLGGEGSDTYIWSKGDGNDIINDGEKSDTSIDTLVLNDVASTDAITLWHSGATHLSIRIEDTGETILVYYQFHTTVDTNGREVPNGYGLEQIEFSDGVIWNVEDIQNNALTDGAETAETMLGTHLDDVIAGNGGDDVIHGYSGDDTIEGGAGDDYLLGGDGSDSYIWSKGHGNDTINESDTSHTEIDKLILTDVDADDVKLRREYGTNDLQVRIISTGEVIDVLNRFQSEAWGRGVEEIHFADGSVWTWQDIQSRTRITAGSSDNYIAGNNGRDNIYGYDGNDTLLGNGGDDKLVGGWGDDTLDGGAGSDLYLWWKGHGNDVIDDDSTSFDEVDTLLLKNVEQADVDLTIDGQDLLVTINETGEVIRVDERFRSATANEGIDVIAYSDGVITEIMASETATAEHTGTIGSDNIVGWDFIDIFEGGDGNDHLTGKKGDDHFTGGKGNDNLKGDEGSDTYYWSKGDGNDVIDEQFNARGEDTDTLVLEDVNPNDVELIRVNKTANLYDDLKIKITSTGETIKIWDFFHSDQTDKRGIDKIVFADGTIWYREEIEKNTQVNGTSSNDDLDGLNNFDDNLMGFDGNDNLDGNSGDDTLIGGEGQDSLYGDAGNDTFIWSKGDGNDYIVDGNYSGDTDKLVLTDVDPSDIKIIRNQGSGDLYIEILSTGEEIRVYFGMHSGYVNYGIEEIEFADGTIWNSERIISETHVEGTEANNVLSGSNPFDDNFFGFGGNDSLYGYAGDDHFVGGLGDDYLNGGAGNDTYVWSKGDGNDFISDGNYAGDTDKLVLTDVDASDIKLTRNQGSGDLYIEILSTGEEIRVYFGMHSGYVNYGIEEIEFADGTIWNANKIIDETVVEGTEANNVLSGSNPFDDNFFGFGGNDSLYGYAGDDDFVGGLGDDYLNGGAGNDTYVWSKGDGNDTIADYDYSDDHIDRLVLSDVDASDVELTRSNNGHDLFIKVVSTGEIIEIDQGFYKHTSYTTQGIEEIEFSDGTIWDFETITQNARIEGDATANTLYGSNEYTDNIFGLAGNDILYGYNGEDVLVGGEGNDQLYGGSNADTFVFNDGDGFDTIKDFELGLDQIDLASLGITFADLTISENNGDAVVSYSEDGTGTVDGQITIEDVAAIDLQEDYFLF